MAVLVTRPDERGQQLVEMLAKAGIVAIHLPLFTIEAGAELNELPNKFAKLKADDYVFIVSKSAVDFAAVFSAALLASASALAELAKSALVSSTTASICFFSKRENNALNGASV